MKTILVSVALFLLGALAQNNFTINTPSNVDECEPLQITWVGGVPPYYLSILPGSDPTGTAIETFNSTNSTSLTWTVNIASGTSIGFTLRDGNGDTAQTAAVNVNPGTSTSCVNTTSVSPGPTASSGSSTAGAATTPSGSGTATGTSTSATATSTTHNGASVNAAQLGAAGILGVAVAALFF